MNAPAVLHPAPPTEGRAAREPTCPECLTAFAPAQPGQLFCTQAHRAAWNNRWTVRGLVWTTLAMVARLTRNGSRGGVPFSAQASTDADVLLRRWVRDDRAAGRMDVRDFNWRRYASGFDPL